MRPLRESKQATAERLYSHSCRYGYTVPGTSSNHFAGIVRHDTPGHRNRLPPQFQDAGSAARMAGTLAVADSRWAKISAMLISVWSPQPAANLATRARH